GPDCRKEVILDDGLIAEAGDRLDLRLGQPVTQPRTNCLAIPVRGRHGSSGPEEFVEPTGRPLLGTRGDATAPAGKCFLTDPIPAAAPIDAAGAAFSAVASGRGGLHSSTVPSAAHPPT